VPSSASRHLVVVGGGISGLAAAHAAHERDPSLRITILEAGPRIGGKLRSEEVAGASVDVGAESLLARRPEAVDLVRSVGLGDDIEHPVTTSAQVWSRGALRALPTGSVMGVPTDVRVLAATGVLSPRGLARVPADRVLPGPPLHEDVAVGSYVAARMGHEVVDRLVEPLLGGVYAGRARELSLAATVPALYAQSREHSSLLVAARAVRAVTPPSSAPVFAGVRGGVARLADATAVASGADVRTSTTVRSLTRTPHGFELLVGSTADSSVVTADLVVLAVPAVAATRLLADISPSAASELSAIEYASSALVTLALRRVDVPVSVIGSSSGFLVPPVEGLTTKAATFSTAKWAWVAREHPDLVFVRGSVGRHGEVRDLHRSDAELIRFVRADLLRTAGVTAAPVDSRVTRWGGGLPQYAVGHLDRIRRARSAVADVPGLALAGAYLDGVGIAACIGSSRAAVADLLPEGRMDP
jgi:oxygen-dependent protoporphyrinogen oxidase